MRHRFALVAALAAAPLAAQDAPPPIQDNSFLVEEAYNQERGVVQHIGVFTGSRGARELAFTQEWPVGSQRHQLSYTVPLLRPGGVDAGLGDATVDYRLQAVGDGGSRVALAPRLGVQLPTGARRVGAGRWGVEAALPASFLLSPRWVAHSNAGLGYTFGDDTEGDAVGASLGQSLVWLAHPNLNFLVETTWEIEDLEAGGDGLWLVSPGVRGAINTRGGVQIVPGIAVPLGLANASGERSLLLYLSVEHAFGRTDP